jgi:hypothetical protein
VPEHAAALNQYTLMPMHMRTYFEAIEFTDARIVESLPFSRGFPVWQLPVPFDAKANMTRRYPLLDARTVIYDIKADPHQMSPVEDAALEARLTARLTVLLEAADAPAELYARYGLQMPRAAGPFPTHASA